MSERISDHLPKSNKYPLARLFRAILKRQRIWPNIPRSRHLVIPFTRCIWLEKHLKIVTHPVALGRFRWQCLINTWFPSNFLENLRSPNNRLDAHTIFIARYWYVRKLAGARLVIGLERPAEISADCLQSFAPMKDDVIDFVVRWSCSGDFSCGVVVGVVEIRSLSLGMTCSYALKETTCRRDNLR